MFFLLYNCECKQLALTEEGRFYEKDFNKQEALGQIGSELALYLGDIYGRENIYWLLIDQIKILKLCRRYPF